MSQGQKTVLLLEVLVSIILIVIAIVNFRRYMKARRNLNTGNSTKYRKKAKWFSLLSLVPAAFFISQILPAGKEKLLSLPAKLVVGAIITGLSTFVVFLYKKMKDKTFDAKLVLAFMFIGFFLTLAILAIFKVCLDEDIRVKVIEWLEAKLFK